MAARTRARVGSLTLGLLFRTRETVPSPTPACAATSLIVAIAPPPGSPGCRCVEPLPRPAEDHTTRRSGRQWKRFHVLSALLEQPALGGVGRVGKRGVVGGSRLVGPTESRQQVGARGVEEVVAAEV